MYNKKQNEKPLFAEVKPCDDEVRQQATNKDYKQRKHPTPIFGGMKFNHYLCAVILIIKYYGNK